MSRSLIWPAAIILGWVALFIAAWIMPDWSPLAHADYYHQVTSR